MDAGAERRREERGNRELLILSTNSRDGGKRGNPRSLLESEVGFFRF